MDIFWRKEIFKGQTRHIDLFAPLEEHEKWNDKTMDESMDELRIVYRKSDKKSVESRELGNAEFAAKNWTGAMEYYNQSLRFAEGGSENVALAYSNRSACFFKLNMFDESLADIELAKKEKLPKRLLPKLEQRQKKCFELLEMAKREPEYPPELDYPANKNFPPLANKVDIKCNEQFGRLLAANDDIPKGRTILLEESFGISHIQDSSMCYTCYRAIFSNFIPCDHCTNVVFCNAECKKRNKTHALECGTFFGMKCFEDEEIQNNIHRTRVIIQTVLNAIAMFPNIETLMRFIDSIVREDPDKLPTSLNDEFSKYHFFFKLKKRIVRPIYDMKRLYKCTLLLPKIRNMIDSLEKKRFLMHLVSYHAVVVDSNIFPIEEGFAVRNVFSMFNHSCDANVTVNASGKICYCTASRALKKGEQLFINYLKPDEMKLPKEQREDILDKFWGFKCKCRKCA